MKKLLFAFTLVGCSWWGDPPTITDSLPPHNKHWKTEYVRYSFGESVSPKTYVWDSLMFLNMYFEKQVDTLDVGYICYQNGYPNVFYYTWYSSIIEWPVDRDTLFVDSTYPPDEIGLAVRLILSNITDTSMIVVYDPAYNNSLDTFWMKVDYFPCELY